MYTGRFQAWYPRREILDYEEEQSVSSDEAQNSLTTFMQLESEQNVSKLYQEILNCK